MTPPYTDVIVQGDLSHGFADPMRSVGIAPMRLGQYMARMAAGLSDQAHVLRSMAPGDRLHFSPQDPYAHWSYGLARDAAHVAAGSWPGLAHGHPGAVIDWVSETLPLVLDGQSFGRPILGTRHESAPIRHHVLSVEEVANVCELLSDLWLRDTQVESSMERIFNHSAFQQIASFGEAAIPFMLGRLPEAPERWSVGLAVASGENPVPPDVSADAAVVAWRQWGTSRAF